MLTNSVRERMTDEISYEGNQEYHPLIIEEAQRVGANERFVMDYYVKALRRTSPEQATIQTLDVLAKYEANRQR